MLLLIIPHIIFYILSFLLLLVLALIFRPKIHKALNSKNGTLLSKKIIASMNKRERLKLLDSIQTDFAEYFIYNTQTNGYDACNIEIERVDKLGKRSIILEDWLVEDSYGGLCGDSFGHLVSNAICKLKEFIKDKKEFIIKDVNGPK